MPQLNWPFKKTTDPHNAAWSALIVAIIALVFAGIGWTMAATPTPLEISSMTGDPATDAEYVRIRLEQMDNDRNFQLTLWTLGAVVTASALLVTFNFLQFRSQTERESAALDQIIAGKIEDRFLKQSSDLKEVSDASAVRLRQEIDAYKSQYATNNIDWANAEKSIDFLARKQRRSVDLMEYIVWRRVYELSKTGAVDVDSAVCAGNMLKYAIKADVYDFTGEAGNKFEAELEGGAKLISSDADDFDKSMDAIHPDYHLMRGRIHELLKKLKS